MASILARVGRARTALDRLSKKKIMLTLTHYTRVPESFSDERQRFTECKFLARCSVAENVSEASHGPENRGIAADGVHFSADPEDDRFDISRTDRATPARKALLHVFCGNWRTHALAEGKEGIAFGVRERH